MARKPSKSPTDATAAHSPIAASYESTGGAGTDLEVDVVVQLLGALLAETTDRLLPADWLPRSIKVQRRDGPRGFDDVTLEAGLPAASGSPIYLQVKRAFSLTARRGEFKAYVESLCAKDAEAPDAPWLAAIIAGKMTPALADVQALTEWARGAQSEVDFNSQCAAPKALNAGKRAVIKALAEHLAGRPEASVWRVLRRLRASEVDYGDESSRDAEALRSRLASLLEPGARSGEDLRQALRGRVLRQARHTPTYTRANVLAELDASFDFLGSPRLSPHLERLDQDAGLALSSIETSVAGVTLLRDDLYAKARAVLSIPRALRMVGDGGGGKSAILARIAMTAERRLVLKDDRVSGRTWAEHAGRLGASIAAQVVVEALGERSGAVLAIDGADRLLSSERRGVVLDVLRALAASPTRANWRLVATARDLQTHDMVLDALVEAGLDPGERVDVAGLGDEDADYLARAAPALSELLRRTDMGGRNRDLFTLREAWRDPDAGQVGSEVGMAGRWASRGDRAAPPEHWRDAAIAQIGEQLLSAPREAIGRAGLDPAGVSALLREGALRAAPYRDALSFTHDIYEDWTLARAFDRRRAELPDLIRTADQPLWWLPAVRLAGQIIVETTGPRAWLESVAQCREATDLDPAWWRTLLVSPLHSERAASFLEAAEPLLLADDGIWLERLVDSLLVLESRPDEDVFKRADGTVEERMRVAAAFAIPNGRVWVPFLRRAADRWQGWPGRLAPKLAQMTHIWLRATEGWEHRTGEILMNASVTWLMEIEDARTFAAWDEHRAPFGYEGHDYRLWEQTATRLREGLAWGVASAPDVVEAYLLRLADRDRNRDCDDLLKMPRRIPALLPKAWADFCISRFAPRRPRVRHDFFMGHFNALGFNDAGLSSLSLSGATPRYAGFDQLFEADPGEALRMLRRFEKRASVYYRHYVRHEDRRRPRPVRVRFPWGEIPLWGDENTFRWARGVLGSEVLGSAYMALDLWMARQAAKGRPLEELFRLVLRPHGLNATLVPCITLAVEHINTPGQIDAAGPILAEPRLWNFDVRRYSDDLTFARQPLVPYYSAHERPAIVEVGARYASRQHLRVDLALPFLMMADGPAQEALNTRVATWSAADLADFDDELDDARAMAGFDQQLQRYRADLDRTSIRLERKGDQIEVSLAPPEPVAAQIAALDRQQAAFAASSRLMLWGCKGLEENQLQPSMTLEEAISAARGYDATALFSTYSQERFNDYLAAQGVASTAAVVARLAADDLFELHRAWVTEVLVAAVRLKPSDQLFDVDEAIMTHDPRVSAAKGLGALVSRGGDRTALAQCLVALATDRHHHIAAAVLSSLDFAREPVLAWAILRAAFGDTQYWRGRRWWNPDLRRAAQDRQKRQETAYKTALAHMRRGVRRPLPPPPPPFEQRWIFQKSWRAPLTRRTRLHPVLYHWGRVKTLLEAVPLESLAVDSELAAFFARYLQDVAAWAKSDSEGRRNHASRDFPFELMWAVGKLQGRLAALTAEAGREDQPWRALTVFEERDYAHELVGHFLDGMARELVASGRPPSAAFWRVWDPAADWVLGPRDSKPRRRRHGWGDLSSATAAAGFVGPYMSPIPPGWPHVAEILSRIDDWAERTQAHAGAAAALLKFSDRMSLDQVEGHALAWIERWLKVHEGDTGFWTYGDIVNRATGVVLRVQPSEGPLREPRILRRVRHMLARLADEGSLAARQALAVVGSQRPAAEG